ncbi:hypothetical protein [Bacillus sp. OTU530]|uniref:hypothetical protein n=1 Tax=Bacillus sp. OTU530 TaxID=3043862 RepID=UPI00313B98B1
MPGFNILNPFFKTKPIDDTGNPLFTVGNPGNVKTTAKNELISIFRNQSIADTNPISSGVIDLSPYKRTLFLVSNATDQPVKVTPLLQLYAGDGAKSFFEWDGESFVESNTITIPSNTLGKYFSLNSYLDILNMPLREVKFSIKADVAPTTGVVNVQALGGQ